jgi:hypothetical protein
MDYRVTGTLSPDATGVYAESGTYSGRPVYVNGVYKLWWASVWVISLQEGDADPAWGSAITGNDPTGTYSSNVNTTGTATVAVYTAPAQPTVKVINWFLEEKIEDSFVRYFNTLTEITSLLKIYPGYTDEEIEYPAVVVMVSNTGLVDDSAEFMVQRQVQIDIAVITEAAPILSGTRTILKTSRQRNAEARSVVLGAICGSTLKTVLAAQGVPGLKYSMVQLNSTARSVEDRKLITVITLDAIAQITIEPNESGSLPAGGSI